MVLEIDTFLTPDYVFLGAFALVVTAIIILTVVEKTMNRKIVLRKREEEKFFYDNLIVLRNMQGNQQQFLAVLDSVVREFFGRKFSVDKNEKYSSLIETFKKKGVMKAMRFSQRIQEMLYGGDKIEEAQLLSLLRDFESLVRVSLGENETSKKINFVDAGAAYIPLNSLFEKLQTNWASRVEEWKQKRAMQKMQKGVAQKQRERMKELQRIERTKRLILQKPKKELEEQRSQQIAEKEKPQEEEKRKRIELFKQERNRMPSVKELKMTQEKNEIMEKLKKIKPRSIAVVPYQIEEPEFQKSRHLEKEPHAYRFIGSVDDLERVERKIKERRSLLAARVWNNLA